MSILRKEPGSNRINQGRAFPALPDIGSHKPLLPFLSSHLLHLPMTCHSVSSSSGSSGTPLLTPPKSIHLHKRTTWHLLPPSLPLSLPLFLFNLTTHQFKCYCPHTSEWRAIYLSMGDLPAAMVGLKETDSPSPRSHKPSLAPQLGVGLSSPSLP